MALDKKKLTHGNEAEVAVFMARSSGAAGSPGTFTQVCINGTFSLPWGKTDGGDDDGTAEAWCEADTDSYAPIVFDKYQMETTIPMLHMPSDAFQLSLKADWKAEDDVYLRVVYTDTQATPGTETEEFKGKLVDWPRDTARKQATTLTPTFRATASIPGGGWPVV